jgi:hypothetical protein
MRDAGCGRRRAVDRDDGVEIGARGGHPSPAIEIAATTT